MSKSWMRIRHCTCVALAVCWKELWAIRTPVMTGFPAGRGPVPWPMPEPREIGIPTDCKHHAQYNHGFCTIIMGSVL